MPTSVEGSPYKKKRLASGMSRLTPADVTLKPNSTLPEVCLLAQTCATGAEALEHHGRLPRKLEFQPCVRQPVCNLSSQGCHSASGRSTWSGFLTQQVLNQSESCYQEPILFYPWTREHCAVHEHICGLMLKLDEYNLEFSLAAW